MRDTTGFGGFVKLTDGIQFWITDNVIYWIKMGRWSNNKTPLTQVLRLEMTKKPTAFYDFNVDGIRCVAFQFRSKIVQFVPIHTSQAAIAGFDGVDYTGFAATPPVTFLSGVRVAVPTSTKGVLYGL